MRLREQVLPAAVLTFGTLSVCGFLALGIGCESVPKIVRDLPEFQGELDRSKKCPDEYRLRNETNQSRIVHWTNAAGTETTTLTQPAHTTFFWTRSQDDCVSTVDTCVAAEIPSQVTVCQGGDCFTVFTCDERIAYLDDEVDFPAWWDQPDLYTFGDENWADPAVPWCRRLAPGGWDWDQTLPQPGQVIEFFGVFRSPLALPPQDRAPVNLDLVSGDEPLFPEFDTSAQLTQVDDRTYVVSATYVVPPNGVLPVPVLCVETGQGTCLWNWFIKGHFPGYPCLEPIRE